MQVGFHVFKYQIDVSVIFCLQDIQQSDNILMVVDLLQEHDFAKRSLENVRFDDAWRLELRDPT